MVGRIVMELPKIRKCQYKDHKYKVGRDDIRWWLLAKTRWQAVKLWLRYVTGRI